MFTLDINFLDDDSRKGTEAFGVEAQPLADSQFILIGGGIALVAMAIAGGIWYVIDQSVQRQTLQLAELSVNEGKLDSKLKELAVVEGSIKKIEEQTLVLVNLFVGDIPISSILSEVRSRTIANVKVKDISQDGKNLKLSGEARNYDDVTDLVLLLKGSPLVEPDGVKLVSATQQPEDKETKIALIAFEIVAPLTKKNVIELIPELESSGAQGAVARIRLLQEKEVLPK
jgi:type IV pilus assembly protein PilN